MSTAFLYQNTPEKVWTDGEIATAEALNATAQPTMRIYDAPGLSVLGNNTGGSMQPVWLTVAELNAMGVGTSPTLTALSFTHRTKPTTVTGDGMLFIDSADYQLKYKSAAGTVYTLSHPSLIGG